MRISRSVRFLRSWSVIVLSAALVAGPHTLTAAGPAPAATTALSITTNPADAAVYVDGRYAGRTPLSAASMTAGDHRIRVVKDGYLENARVITVAAGRPQAFEITMTPSTGREAADQVTSGGGGGGSKKKWLWIGLAAGGGTAAAIALTGSNKPPVISSTTATPTTALQSSTSVSLTTQASDPENKGLSYSWDFGDGASGSGQSASHVYATSGAFSPVVTVSDGKKSATGTASSVTVRSMTGTWNGTVTTSGIVFQVIFTLTQSGSSISGTYRDFEGNGTVTGTVSSNNGLTITVNQPPFSPFAFSGTVASTINTWSGNALGGTFSVVRQ